MRYNAVQARALVEEKVRNLEDKKVNWTRWQNAYEGKSWWASDLPLYKSTEVDNQLFPFVESLIGILQRAKIWDRVDPPSDSPKDLAIARGFEEALSDFWRENKRDGRSQSWLRTVLIKGRTIGFLRVEPNADFPFLCDAFGPESFVYGSEGIDDIQKQPWIARILETTKAYLKTFNPSIATALENAHTGSEETKITVYDFWSKEGGGQNTLVTSEGVLIFEKKWPYPGSDLYPFFEIQDIPVLNSAEPISTVGMAYALQRTYDKERAQIRENAEFMGNPPIVVDVESGIDVNRIAGRPRLIIRKWRDGNFSIVPVPPLPGYVERQPEVTRDNLQRMVGINELIMRGFVRGVREKGALSTLMSGPFARADLKLVNLQKGMNDANNILINFFKQFMTTAKRAFKDELGVRYLAFSPADLKGRFKSNVEVSSLDAERERITKSDVTIALKFNLLDQKTALKGLGWRNPEAILKAQEEDVKRRLEFERQRTEFLERQARARGLQEAISARRVPPTEEEVKRRVPTPEEAEKRAEAVREEVTGVRRYPRYADFLGNVLLPGLRARLRTLTFEKEVRILPDPTGKLTVPYVKIYAPSTKDREEIVATVSDIAEKISFTGTPEKEIKIIKKVAEKVGVPYIDKKALLINIQKGIINSKTIENKKMGRFQGLPGLFLTEPHAEMIWTKQKKLILKGRNYQNQLDKNFLLLGDKVYGIIRYIYGGRISLNDIKTFERFHRVTAKERKKWWGARDLYAYAFQIQRFTEPVAYEKPKGLQTYLISTKLLLPEAETKVAQAKPVTGDLKVISLKPMKMTPVAKPEKKAITTAEVYSAERLKEILPTDHEWDVSWKGDGIRCFTHKKGERIKFFSDEAKDIPLKRLTPIAEEIRKKFPYDVILDGELMLYEDSHCLKHQGIAGYVHGTWDPKPEELRGLRYVIWDLLYIRKEDISRKPFSARSKALDLFLKYKEGTKDQVRRILHAVGSRDDVPKLTKKVESDEGVIVKAMDSSYYATHLLFKSKKQYELDVKVIARETTKAGAWVYHSVLADGTYMGQSYGQKYVKAIPGDVIRMTMQHVTLRPDGSIGWFAPKPVSLKAKYKKAPAGPSVTQPKIGRPDTMAQVYEIYLAGGGKEERWKAWLPKFEIWKKEEMPKIIEKIKTQKGILA